MCFKRVDKRAMVMRSMQGGKSETSSTSKIFEVQGEYMGV
jgi:hypothetical protein